MDRCDGDSEILGLDEPDLYPSPDLWADPGRLISDWSHWLGDCGILGLPDVDREVSGGIRGLPEVDLAASTE